MKENEMKFWRTYYQRFEGSKEFWISLISAGIPMFVLAFLGFYFAGTGGLAAGTALGAVIDLGLVFPYLEYKEIW